MPPKGKPAVVKDCYRVKKASIMDPVAADLDRFMNVTSMGSQSSQPPTVPETSQKIPEPKPEKKESATAKPIESLIIITEKKHEMTKNTNQEERLGWSTTGRDLAKDLTNRRISLGQEANDRLNKSKTKDQNQVLTKQLASLPYHALWVRWRLSFNFPVYTPRIVYGILSRFGSIQTMGTLSPNSVFVVFHHEYHACRAIVTPMVGFNYCPLIIRWWYLDRYKYPITDPAEVKREDLLVSDGRLERNCKRHIAQIKREFWRKAAALSYDVSTFRP